MLTSTVNTYEVTGSSATSYTFNQPIHKADDLTVYVSAVVVPASSGSNPHTITVATDKQSATVVFTSAPGAVPLKFERTVAYTQETDLANNSLFDAESLETSLDNIVMQTQQAGRLTDAALGFDPSIAASDYNTTVSTASTLNKTKAQRLNKALAFDANGDLTVSTDDIDAQIATVAASATASATSATASAASATSSAADLATFQGIFRGSSTSTPGSPTDGDLWFDTNTGVNVMKVYNSTATAWEQLTPSSSNQTNINAAVADAVDIGKVASKDAEIGRLGTDAMSHASTGHITLLGTTAAVADLAILGTTDIVADMALLGTTDCVADMAILGTSDVVADMAILATTDIVADMVLLGTTDVVADMALLGTSACVADMAILATSDIVADLAILGTAAIVEDMAYLGTSAVVADLDILATSANVTNMATLGASGVVTNIAAVAGKETEIGRLGTSDAVADMALLAVTAVIADMSDVADVNTEIALLGTSAMATASSGHLALLGTSAMAHASTGHLKVLSDINANITTVATNNANVTTVATNVANVNLTGGSIANVNTVAASIADVNRYANEYKIAASAPGSPSEGDMWMDTTTSTFKVHNGTSFATVTEGQSAAEVTTEATAQAISMAIALG